MVYDILGKAVPLGQNQQSWVACSLLSYGSQNKELSHCRGHNANRGVPHKVLYGGLQGEQYNHSHFLPHIFDKCSYLSQGQLLQRLDIQAIDIPLLAVELDRPSSLDAYHQSKCAVTAEALTQDAMMLPSASVSWLLTPFYPLKHRLSSAWSLLCKVVSYSNYITHQELVQWSD